MLTLKFRSHSVSVLVKLLDLAFLYNNDSIFISFLVREISPEIDLKQHDSAYDNNENDCIL